jgi:hypothetical protein
MISSHRGQLHDVSRLGSMTWLAQLGHDTHVLSSPTTGPIYSMPINVAEQISAHF